MHATCQGNDRPTARHERTAPPFGTRSFRTRSFGTLPWVVLLLAALVLAGCSGSNDADRGDGASDDVSTTTEVADSDDTAAEPERFEGSVDEFYRVPDELPEGGPGTVIRTMPVEAPEGLEALRIMYVTTDEDGAERAATGVVHFPTAEAPDDGWPVVAWAHGTTGLASQCAPSRSAGTPPDYGIEGVLVSADYLGLGPEGELHPYLSAAAEGHAVIDAVAAARSLPEVHAGEEWVVVGVSQGGHAALVTNEMAADRLPDMTLLGAAALAPGAELSADYGDVLQIRVITSMALVGMTAEDDDIALEDYLGPEALAASSAIETGCVGDIITAMLPVAASDGFFIQEPRSDPVGQAWLARNDPGQVVGAAPLLVVQGGADILVVPARTAALRERLCSIGQHVENIDIPTADHDSVVEDSLTDVGAWLRARFDGEPATDEC